jgi:CHAT domain-containing protein
MGSLEAAEAHYLARLKGIEGKNRKGLELDALKNLGRIYRIQGRLETAEATLETARGSLTVRADEEVLIELGLCRFEMGRHTEAVDTFEEALRIAETAVELPGVWTARYYLGQIAEQQRNRTLAISHYRGAVEAVESVATNLSVDFYKASFLENKTQTYDALIRLLGPTQPKEAFLFAERRRAQSYLDSLRRKGLKFKPTGRLAVEKSRAERLVIGKQSALREQYSKPQQQRNKDLISRLELELAAARTEHLEAFRMAQMERSSEAYREGVLAPLPVETIQARILKQGQALVQYVVTEESAFAFVVDSKQCRFYLLPTSRLELAQDIEDLLRPIRQLREGSVDLMHLDFNLEKAHQIFQTIFEPLEPAIAGSDRLILVPDDALFYLPFESLPRSAKLGPIDRTARYAEYSDVDWLIRHYSITYAISATSLDPDLARDRPPPSKLVAFAAPLLEQTGADGRAGTLRGSTAEMMDGLTPLPETSREIASIARLMSKHVEVVTLEGSQASEAAFFQHAPGAGYLHFAAHAFVDDEFPDYSTLVLSADDQADGFLQTYEVLQADIASRLVVLSGCDTALGRFFRGEGLLGLQRAFLAAGAQSTIVSLWGIEDSAADFMELFYGSLSEGSSIEDSMRRAKLQYMTRARPIDSRRRLSLSHPFFWAGSVLTVSTGFQ